MTHSLEELIETSGQNAEDKGFHDDGNLLRAVLDHLEHTTSDPVLSIKTPYGDVQMTLSHTFWTRLYAAYKGNRQFLIVSEVVEALDEVRNGKPSIYEVDGKPEGSAVELGDAVIRIADYAFEFNEPVVEAIDTKAAYNKTREKMHGGKLS